MRWAFALPVFLYALPALAQEPPPAPDPAPAPADPQPPPEPEPEPVKPSTVLIDAKDELGRDLRTATVVIDGAAIAYSLEGKEIEVSPGPHTIALQRNDGPPVRETQTVTIVAGERARPLHYTFHANSAPSLATHPIYSDAPLVPRFVAGAGLIAIVTGGVLILSTAGFDADAHAGRRDAGIITVVSGAGVLAAGLLWYFLARGGEPQTASSNTPFHVRF